MFKRFQTHQVLLTGEFNRADVTTDGRAVSICRTTKGIDEGDNHDWHHPDPPG